MDHQEGKDPSKKGPFEGFQPHGPSRQPAASVESEKYHNSAPPVSVRKDGVYFFGYKRELGPEEPTEHL